jgi:hypothetical protein
MPRKLAIGIAVTFLLCGCGSVRDSFVRGMMTDHRFRRAILPSLHDSYRLKMRNGVQLPGPPEKAPESMDRG